MAAVATPRRASPSPTCGCGRSSRSTAARASAGTGVPPWRTASPNAASPSVPDTQRSSPGRAPLRSSACPRGTLPITVTVMTTPCGDRVVSPPASTQR